LNGGLIFLDETGSTQDELRTRLEAGEDVFGVASGHQTEGRGRHGRVWLSTPGESLALSVAIRAPHNRRAYPFIGMRTAARIANRYGAQVRWPNDVVAEEKKLAGILVEAVEVNRERLLLIGIGLNLNQTAFPSSLADRATSTFLMEGQVRVPREEAEAIADLVRQPAPGGWEEIRAEWEAVDDTVGKWFRAPGEDPRLALGVDAFGRLRLQDSDDPNGERSIAAAEAYFGK